MSDSKQELIDQLRARVAELEGLLADLFDCDDPRQRARIRGELEALLNRQPPQSLESHDREVAARALEEWVNKNFHDAEHLAYAGAVVHRWREKESARLIGGLDSE